MQFPPIPDTDYFLYSPESSYENSWASTQEGYHVHDLITFGRACAIAALEEASKILETKVVWVDCDCGCNGQKPSGCTGVFARAAGIIYSMRKELEKSL